MNSNKFKEDGVAIFPSFDDAKSFQEERPNQCYPRIFRTGEQEWAVLWHYGAHDGTAENFYMKEANYYGFKYGDSLYRMFKAIPIDRDNEDPTVLHRFDSELKALKRKSAHVLPGHFVAVVDHTLEGRFGDLKDAKVGRDIEMFPGTSKTINACNALILANFLLYKTKANDSIH